MSLLPKQVMTPENLAAHQSNARRSQGAATPAGLERLRAANLRHGVYSQKADGALAALGKDPSELASLIDSLFDLYAPQNAYHARLVQGLARALWRMERADRIVGVRFQQVRAPQSLPHRAHLERFSNCH